MNDRELSKLSYLAQALAASPNSYDSLIGVLEHNRYSHLLIPPSRELSAAMDALRSVFAARFSSGAPVTREVLLGAAEELQASEDRSVRTAGNSLEWAVISIWPDSGTRETPKKAPQVREPKASRVRSLWERLKG